MINDDEFQAANVALDLIGNVAALLSNMTRGNAKKYLTAVDAANALLNESDVDERLKSKTFSTSRAVITNYIEAIDAIETVRKETICLCVFCALYVLTFVVALALNDWRFIAFAPLVAFVQFLVTKQGEILQFVSSLVSFFKK